MENFFSKKVFGEDKDGLLKFYIRKMTADTLPELRKLCEDNPNKCANIRPELCKKIFVLYGYPKIPQEACKMYVDIVNSIKEYNHPKKIVRISIKPCQDLFYAVSLYGNKTTKDFLVKCGYETPTPVKIKTRELEDTPTIKLKKSSKKKSTIKR
jgi:hypothetical protein